VPIESNSARDHRRTLQWRATNWRSSWVSFSALTISNLARLIGRRFYDLNEAGLLIATKALRRIGQLYPLKERIPGRTADERRQER
jgi:hypothetical protein